MTIEEEFKKALSIANGEEAMKETLIAFGRHLDRVEAYMAWAKETLERTEARVLEEAKKAQESRENLEFWKARIEESLKRLNSNEMLLRPIGEGGNRL